MKMICLLRFDLIYFQKKNLFNKSMKTMKIRLKMKYLIIFFCLIIVVQQLTKEIHSFFDQFEEKNNSIFNSIRMLKRSNLIEIQCKKCSNSTNKIFDINQSKGIRRDSKLFLILRSRSIIICLIPKCATTTILSHLIYLHLEELFNHINGIHFISQWTNLNEEKLFNKNILIQILRKVFIFLFEK